MSIFSERYGYTKPSDVLIRERITPEIQNAICSCYDRLQRAFSESMVYFTLGIGYAEVEKYLWTYFLYQREGDFNIGYSRHRIVATRFIEDEQNEWYRKLDIIETTIECLRLLDAKYDRQFFNVSKSFIYNLNHEFERLNFAYRVINNKIVGITAEEEIKTIEYAVQKSYNNIKMHLDKALELYAQRPNGDFRNSIKESISAVEAYCRERTGTNTLGAALSELKTKGIIIPATLEGAFKKLYDYTNQPDTGIRHALMDDKGNYTPKAEEALFMLVSCCAFINYLRKK